MMMMMIRITDDEPIRRFIRQVQNCEEKKKVHGSARHSRRNIPVITEALLQFNVCSHMDFGSPTSDMKVFQRKNTMNADV